MNDYVVIDLETTGLSPEYCDIVELSAVRFADFEPAETFSTLVWPARGINYQACLVNGITEDMVEGAPLIEEVRDEFLAFVKDDRILVGQNISFDLGFLRRNGIPLSEQRYKIYDTMRMAKRHLCRGEVRNHKLGTLCGYYQIENEEAHRGVSDCIATGKLFARLVAEMERKEE
jgi:DNA polymerase III epsilon subunit family exonuclease